MGIHLHLDNLPIQYQKKLRNHELTQETIASLASSISRKYMLQKRTWKRLIVIFSFIPLILAVLGLFGRSSSDADPTIFVLSCIVALLIELLIFVIIYFIAVARIPRQFARCLKKGYPELEMIYGYEVIVDGRLGNSLSSHHLPFSLCIEEVFELNNSNDIVVTGFSHGLIHRNQSVYVTCKNISPKNRKALIVSGIETAPNTSSTEAADCHVALMLKNGKSIPLYPGMYLYRLDT